VKAGAPQVTGDGPAAWSIRSGEPSSGNVEVQICRWFVGEIQIGLVMLISKARS